jgi:hypothetical protein
MLKKNIFIPEGSRCCSDHMINHRLKTAAIDRLAPLSIQYRTFNSNDIQLLITKWQMLFERQKRLDFDNLDSLSDDECKAFTSLSKTQFDDLIFQISTSKIRNSSNRSIRTAIAILLCKLRLGLSNKILAILFQLPEKRAISRALESARDALMTDFVPYNLGFSHITRREIIDQHTSTIARQLMCGDEADKAIVVVDSKPPPAIEGPPVLKGPP